MPDLTASHHDEITAAARTPLGRLGGWAADRRRTVVIVWIGVVLALGALAPFADRALSGAGWEALGSESVTARHTLEASFPGRGSYALSVVVAGRRAGAIGSAEMRDTVARVEAVLRSDAAVAGVSAPRDGRWTSRGGSTAVVVGRAAARPDAMVEAAARLKTRVAGLSTPDIAVRITGPAAMWADFNAVNKAAMLKAEMLSWPLTLALLVLAFGTLVAAGLPLILTMAGLLGAGGLLFVLGQIADVSIWAMNFAMMFAIALGIDYALFVVVRFRAALAEGHTARDATVLAMATSGKAVLVSGLTVIVALVGLTLVPVPAFRSVPLGIGSAVTMVLAATLTLLPAVLSRLGHRIDRGRMPSRAAIDHRSPRFAAWGRRLWSRPAAYGGVAVAILLALAAPVAGLRTGMPTAAALPVDADSREGAQLLERAFGAGSANPVQIVAGAPDATATRAALGRDPGVVAVSPAERSGGHVLLTAVLDPTRGREATTATIDRVRRALPAGALVGGPAAETRDLERALVSRLPLVIGVVLLSGFALLVALLRAPVAAAAAVALSLLATAAAFGVGRLVFQDGVLDGLAGWQAQGFVDAWAPIFFFTLIFALAMDYTVFLLAAVKAVHDRTGDVRAAVVEGLAMTGRTINAAAAVMVVVFMTFGLSGAIAPREMGIILAVAVLLDATLIRLLLQPVVLRLLGARAWWMPGWLDRLAPRVEPAHGHAASVPARP